MADRRFLLVNNEDNSLDGFIETSQSLPIKIKKVERDVTVITNYFDLFRWSQLI